MKRLYLSLFVKIMSTSLLLLTVCFGAIWLYVVPSYEQRLYDDRVEATTQVIDIAFSMLDRIRSRGKELGETDAQTRLRALGYLAELRYDRFSRRGHPNYLWVHDLDAVMLMHPFRKDLVGRDLSTFRDAEGTRVFGAMNELVRKQSEGILRYAWPLPNGTVPAAKASYVRLYKPWGWVVGSGVYLDDIYQRTTVVRERLLAGTGVLFAGALLASFLIARRINRPYRTMHLMVDRIARELDTSHDPEDASDTGMAMQTMQRMLEEMRLAKEKAEQANVRKSEFIAMTSHELRAPLANIAGLTDLMLEKECLPEESVEDIRLIATSANNLLHLINDLLDMSRIEAGKLELHYQETDPSLLVDDLFRLAEPAARDRETLLDRLSEERLPRLYCAPVRVRQILVNLVGNAIKFTHGGRVSVGMHLVPPPAGTAPAASLPEGFRAAALQIVVADTGIGMSEEQIQRIFAPYEQAEVSTSSRYGGTGLGLAIVTRLAGLMGGTVEVTSTPGAGSVFEVTLPVGVKQEPAVQAASRGDSPEVAAAC